MNEALNYANPRDAVRPPPDGLRRIAISLSGISLTLGVTTTLLFAILDSKTLLFPGLFGLLIGFVLNYAGFVCGVIYASTAMFRKFPPPSSRLLANVAVLVPVATLIATMFLFYLCLELI